jgi:hypothetical protein
VTSTRNKKSTNLKTLLKFLLLFVNYSKSEINFVGFFEVWLHPHDLRKCLLCVLKRAVSVIEDANAVPQFGFLAGISFKPGGTNKSGQHTFGSGR